MSEEITISPDQQSAVEAILTWLEKPKAESGPFFVLSGAAGTGKTTCVRELSQRLKGKLVFTAPTNKAARVLRRAVAAKDYAPECRTIYSLLGLRMEASGEVKELKAPEDPIDLSKFLAVIVDEASMVNRQLMEHISKAAEASAVRFLFLGDAAQLPPVGEQRSLIWDQPNDFHLSRVLRHDNQILSLATRLREIVDHPSAPVRFASDNARGEGVWRMLPPTFDAAIFEAIEKGEFSLPDAAKIIAWRNTTVDHCNRQVRGALFDYEPGALPRWLPEDRVIFTAPAKNSSDEIIATTDAEGKVDKVTVGAHPVFGAYKVWTLGLTLDDGQGTAQATVVHQESERQLAQDLNDLRAQARNTPRVWKEYWTLHDAFHYLRHAYAITAHRSQGSTYDTAFVRWDDILHNPNRSEALRCFYVACTRAKRRLILG